MATAELKENSKTPNINFIGIQKQITSICLLYTSPSPRD